jgi:AbrB family looped-hinge helix DNA binding protein
MTVKAKITSKGQITLPLEVRMRLGLRQGDQIEFDLSKPETVIRPVKRRESPLDKWVGIAKGAFPGGSDEIDAWIREMRGDRDEDGD